MSIVDTPTALDVVGLKVAAQRREAEVAITDDVNVRVSAGEAVAIVGESGSGKSITAKAMMRLLPPGLTIEGDLVLNGRSVARASELEMRKIRGTEIALIMQDPFTLLNPLEQCGAQLTAGLRDDNGRKLSAAARRDDARRRLAEVGITDPLVAERYPFELSGGMRQRVGIAAAIARNPRVLIADEPTTALDVTTQAEILALLHKLRVTHGIALVLITHDLRVAFSVADRVYVMYAGEIVETADGQTLDTDPAHPYTASLLRAEPPLSHRVATLAEIPGSVPSPGERPYGCRFAPRCAWATPECSAEPVALRTLDRKSHLVRCIRSEQIRDSLGARPPAAAVRETDLLSDDREPIIATVDAARSYGKKRAVAGATIQVQPGESVGIVGESGSGKTTLARMLVGLTRPSSGSVTVGGVDLAGPVTRAQWGEVRGTVQMVFQDPYSTLNPSRTIGSTLRDALRMVSGADLDTRISELLQRVGLPAHYAKRMPAQLSGGERQRVAIARGLAREPSVLVCDEVVSALDVSVQALVLNLLRDLQRDTGVSFVFITHDLAVVRQMTERVYVMNQGHIVEEGRTDDVLDDPQDEYTRRLIASVPHH